MDRAVRAADRTGNPFAIAFAALSRGRLSGYQGRLDEARRAFAQAIQAYDQMGDVRFVLAARSDLGHALRKGGALDEAEAVYRTTIHEWQPEGNIDAINKQLEGVSGHPDRQGERPDPGGTSLLGSAEATARSRKAPIPQGDASELKAANERRTLATRPLWMTPWRRAVGSPWTKPFSLGRSGTRYTAKGRRLGRRRSSGSGSKPAVQGLQRMARLVSPVEQSDGGRIRSEPDACSRPRVGHSVRPGPSAPRRPRAHR